MPSVSLEAGWLSPNPKADAIACRLQDGLGKGDGLCSEAGHVYGSCWTMHTIALSIHVIMLLAAEMAVELSSNLNETTN